MTSLNDVRQKHPEYKDVPDEILADGLYNKFYKEKLSPEDYYKKVGVALPSERAPGAPSLPALQRPKGNPAEEFLVRQADKFPSGGATEFVLEDTAKFARDVGATGQMLIQSPGEAVKAVALGVANSPRRIYEGMVEASEGVLELGDPDRAPNTLPTKLVTGPINVATEVAGYVPIGRATKAASATAKAARPVTKAARPVTKAAGPVAESARAARAARAAEVRAVGITPNIANTSEGNILPSVLQQTSENIIGGVTARKGVRQGLAEAEKAVKSVANEFSRHISINEAGEAAASGARRFNERSVRKGRMSGATRSKLLREPERFSSFRDKSSARYDKVFSMLDMNADASIEATKGAVESATRRFETKKLNQFADTRVARRLKAALKKKEDIPLADLRELRSLVRLSQKDVLTPNVDQVALKNIERAIGEDIAEAVAQQGGPVERLRAIDALYARGIERINGALKPFIIADEKANPEAAYRAIIQAAQGGGKGDIAKLRALRKSLNDDSLNDISAGIIGNMGRRAEDRAFSATQFTTQWQNMSPAAKDVLFRRGEKPGLRARLDLMAKAVERQARIEKAANFSNSGVSTTNFATLASTVVNPVLPAFVAAAGNGIGYVLTSPKALDWLLRVQRLDLRAPSMPRGQYLAQRAAIIGALGAIKEDDDATRRVLAEVYGTLLADENEPAAQPAQSREPQATQGP